MTKSFLLKVEDVRSEWFIVDASDQIVGRLAVKIATILMGKHKPTYTPHVACGDFVVVLNAEKVRFSGQRVAHKTHPNFTDKMAEKTYESFTGYPNGRKVTVGTDVLVKDPTKFIHEAVRRMLPKNKLRAKMVLKVPTEPLMVVVDKTEFRLWLLLGDNHLLDYPVGLGRDERTPEGSFTIQWKTKNPEWTDPKTGRVLRYGDSGHVIGSRWLGFAGPDGARTGFGIHGTVEPSSVGKNQSDGCVRMLTEDVESLFDLVPPGVLVIVGR